MKLPFFHAKMLALIRLNSYLCPKYRNKKSMEDIIKFLVVAGTIAFGIYRQFSKEKKENADYENPTSDSPDEIETPPPTIFTTKPVHIPPHNLFSSEGVRSTRTQHSSTTPPPQENKTKQNRDQSYTIHTAEEARRAIIWSEILQRKY